MTAGAGLEDLSRTDLLDSVGLLAAEERRAQVLQLQAAAVWADANDEHTIDRTVMGLPGRPSLKLYGGNGTPYVTTGAGAELGARMDRSTGFGDALVADALDLRHRLPQLWRRVLAQEVFPSYARQVAKRTRALEPDEASYVDERVAEYADGRLPWGRFLDLVDAAVVAAAPAAAEAREAAARVARFARTTRSSEQGMRGLYLRSHAGDIAKVDAMVGHLARILHDLGSTETLDQRRATAMVTLASPVEVIKLLAQYDAWQARPTDPTTPEPPGDEETAPPDPAADEPVVEPVETTSSDPDGPVAESEPSVVEPVEATTAETEQASPIAHAVDLFRRSGDLASLGEKPLVDWGKVLPSFTIYVHLYGGLIHAATSTTSEGGQRALVGFDRPEAPDIVRVEGIGVATEAWLRTHLSIRPETKVTVKPVIDLEGQAPVDDWEIPERHRQAVRLMTPADCFPWGSATVHQSGGWPGMQIDHTEPWQPPPPDQPDQPRESKHAGRSRIGNYGPMTQLHHNLKTHHGWTVKQPFPGIFLWRDPGGAHYLVDHTGTRRLNPPA